MFINTAGFRPLLTVEKSFPQNLPLVHATQKSSGKDFHATSERKILPRFWERFLHPQNLSPHTAFEGCARVRMLVYRFPGMQCTDMNILYPNLGKKCPFYFFFALIISLWNFHVVSFIQCWPHALSAIPSAPRPERGNVRAPSTLFWWMIPCCFRVFLKWLLCGCPLLSSHRWFFHFFQALCWRPFMYLHQYTQWDPVGQYSPRYFTNVQIVFRLLCIATVSTGVSSLQSSLFEGVFVPFSSLLAHVRRNIHPPCSRFARNHSQCTQISIWDAPLAFFCRLGRTRTAFVFKNRCFSSAFSPCLL